MASLPPNSGAGTGSVPASPPTTGGSTSTPEPDRPTWIAGGQLAECLVDRHTTYHLAAEAMTLLPDESVRRTIKLHVSLPQPGLSPLSACPGILVPLLLVSKRMPRHEVPLSADMSGPYELPLLSDGETSRVGGAAILAMIDQTTRAVLTKSLWRRVSDVVSSPTPTSSPELEKELTATDNADAAAWLALLGTHRLIVAVVPGDQAGARRVLTLSCTHGLMVPDEKARDRRLLVLAGWGATDFRIAIPELSPIQFAADQHTFAPELPDGLAYVRSEPDNYHYHGDTDPWPTTMVRVAFDRRGQLTTIKLSAVLVAVLLGAVTCTDHALEVWRKGSDGASALLLAAPALLFALLARPSDGMLMTRFTRPLRMLALALAFVLGLAAVSLIGELQDPWIHPYWWLLSATSAMIALLPPVDWLRPQELLRATRDRLRGRVNS